ncbi:hypothetical protein OF117_06625 [Geodermatophilus sp. YIM 151500]|uniref:hypothetical protein n=1 Tax=Geodermatophilus sp. YIM 151500 TaxID=2984531 RepID=UPI0021E3C58B|nr:hypothetical protein [Geodermatophilus sp. YIM 151500]MCV2489032.1 hypothetical protein [Geodermatophilus sp. YIM 151500]
MSDRVVVFIDYQNVHGWARRLFLPVNAPPPTGTSTRCAWHNSSSVVAAAPQR